MKSIAAEIENLRKSSLDDLRETYREHFGREPRVKYSREWLWKRIAWRIQEKRFGGLSALAKRRVNELIAELDLPSEEKQRAVTGALRRPGTAKEPVPGTVLSRKWRDREVSCKLVEGGYESDGVVYRSLTAAARAVTGSRWNGKLFWGLTKRKKAR